MLFFFPPNLTHTWPFLCDSINLFVLTVCVKLTSQTGTCTIHPQIIGPSVFSSSRDCWNLFNPSSFLCITSIIFFLPIHPLQKNRGTNNFRTDRTDIQTDESTLLFCYSIVIVDCCRGLIISPDPNVSIMDKYNLMPTLLSFYYILH